MHLRKVVTPICMLLALGNVSTLCASQNLKPFGVESGTVVYEIQGGGQLTEESNLNVHATSILHFKEWGETKTQKLEGVVETSGVLPYRVIIQKFKKETKDTIVTVDYKNEQLLERKKSSVQKDLQKIQTQYLIQEGNQTIAGVRCQTWKGMGVEKCIYKGIVLKLESHVYDVSYVKVATEVSFDTNNSGECDLPDYPVHPFALFRDNIKTKDKYKSEDFSKVIDEVITDAKESNQSYQVGDFKDPKRKKFIDRITRDIFEKQKVLLPHLLQSMKKMRECLQTVENPFEANACGEDFHNLKAKLGEEDNDFVVLWSEKKKEGLLDKIEEEIIDLESRIACVKRSKNIHDLSSCMK